MEQDEQCTALSHFRLILSSGELARRRTSACETSPFIFAYADQLPSVDKNRPGRPVSKGKEAVQCRIPEHAYCASLPRSQCAVTRNLRTRTQNAILVKQVSNDNW
jgi:hypothetical protein